ncbi:hypothetical protein [Mycolicibacter senuensis]|uniref:DUF4386 domain-containing protein n=1 Tax=Mycolicibacter senuensis TaxID=386913 RepID=A0A7I9XNN6_9MYCO|nr:hypothetical protein [Mycolicibacter senuensis]MDQ2628150.1 hypothetical protein [Actinomycetota bacterium]ORW66151.1 hypothetical protein AWC24_16000 [Mycolicibacter senuensis]GFG71368.1 hypothetical protein MSEN_30880 [Mycolicibacter senuensis]
MEWDAARVARWSGTLGFALPVVTLAVYPIWSFPGTQTLATEVAWWATQHHDRLVVTMLLNTVGVTLWLVFGGAVWTLLRDRLPVRSVLAPCFAAGFIGCVTLLLAGFTAFDILLYRYHSPEAAALLYDLAFGLLAMSGMPTVVALGAFAVAVYVYGVLPRYTGHLAVAAAAVHPLLLLAFVVGAGPLSLEGLTMTAMPAFLFAWILGTALAMPRRP